MQEIVNQQCNRCTLSNTCKNICQAGIGAESEGGLMIISEMPSWYDEENNTVLGSPPARIVDAIIKDVIGGDMTLVYKTHLVKCKTPESRKPEKEEIKACNFYLQQEIARKKPTAILALGDTVFQALCGEKHKVAMSRGKVTAYTVGKDEEKFTTKVIPTFSPYYVDKAKNKLEDFAKDINKAYNFAAGIVVSRGTEIVICDTIEKIEQAVAYCKQTGALSIDFETDEIDEDEGTFKEGFRATSVSLSFQAGSAYVIPLEHFESPFSKAEVTTIVRYIGRELMANRNVRKFGHNINYEMHIFRLYGWTVFRGRMDDSMIMHHLFDETKRHGLKELVAEFYPAYSGYEDDIAGWKWHEVPWKPLSVYNGTDTDMTLRICTLLESYLLQDEKVYRIYRNMSMAAVKPLFYAEMRGMLIDDVYLQEAIKEVDGFIETQEKALRSHKLFKRYEAAKAEAKNYEMIKELNDKVDGLKQKRLERADKLVEQAEAPKTTAKKKESLIVEIEGLRKGTLITKTEENYKEKIRKLKTGELSAYDGFNFGSWQQLEDLFYDSEFGFRFITFTRGTGKEILEDLNDDSGFIDELLLLRTLEKMNGTYLKGLWNRMDKDKRVHTQLKIIGTVSGRLASANPNLQNIPNIAKLKSELAIKVVGMIKACFKCPDGYTMLQKDYSQAELRVIASFAKEITMLTAYAEDRDLHAITASKMLGVTIDQFYELAELMQKEGRTRAKAGNFGLIYGMGWKGFMAYAKKNYKVILTETEAKNFISLFFDLYSGLPAYHEDQIDKARHYGWVRTLYGRKRHTPDIHSNDDYKRSEEERIAINSPVQGTAGEFTIFDIALLHHRLSRDIHLAITVHDSIMYYIPDAMLMAAIPILKYTSENLPNMQYFLTDLGNVGMKVDMEATKKNWKDLKPLEKFLAA